ncbi:uncharacterized protein LOC108950631 [Ciona intestinalis]
MAEMFAVNGIEPIISICVSPDVSIRWISLNGWRVDPAQLSLPDIKFSTLNHFLGEVMKLKLCEGIDPSCSTRNCRIQHLQQWSDDCLSSRSITRSPGCKIAILTESQCQVCSKYEKKVKFNKLYYEQRRDVKDEDLVNIDDGLHSDFMTLLESEGNNMNEWQHLFFKEQIQNSKTSAHGRRYHPDIVRWAIELYSRSPAAYQQLLTSDVLKLPSSRTLQKYRNIGTNSPGINPIAVESMKRLQEPVEGYLTVDEMKVKEGLVYQDGQLVGFVDFGDRKVDTKIATHICMFYVRSMKKEISMPLSWWPTTVTTALQLMSTYWEAVGRCETNNVHVNAIVADGAPTNKRFFSILHGGSYTIREGVFTAPNPYRPTHPIFICTDPSHLLKV